MTLLDNRPAMYKFQLLLHNFFHKLKCRFACTVTGIKLYILFFQFFSSICKDVVFNLIVVDILQFALEVYIHRQVPPFARLCGSVN